MKNLVAPEPYDEVITRLAFGLEPVDALRRSRTPSGVVALLENVPKPFGRWRPIRSSDELHSMLPAMERHGGARFALRHGAGFKPPFTVRVLDAGGRRRFVPRRLTVAVPDAAAVQDAERPPRVPTTVARRAVRPWLFAGAAYDAPSAITGIRGRVLMGDALVRWCRLEARLVTANGPGALVGRAHGDDRGEFLLALAFPPDHVEPIGASVRVAVRVYGRAPSQFPTDPDAYVVGALEHVPAAERDRADYLRRSLIDPLWDLPEEPVENLSEAAQTVARGQAIPDGYTASAGADVEVSVPVGVVMTHRFPFTT